MATDGETTVDLLWPSVPQIRWKLVKRRVATYTHVWEIENVRSKLITEDSITTTFQNSAESKYNFTLQLHHRDDSKRELYYLELDFDMQAYYKKSGFGIGNNVSASVFRACIVDKNKNKINIRQQNKFQNIDGRGLCIVLGKFIKRDELIDKSSDLLVDDVLTIMCTVDVLVDDQMYIDNQLEVQRPWPNNPHSSITSLKVDALFDQSQWSDVIISAGGRDFPVIRAILSFQSSVFRSMFEHDMKEKQEQQIVIVDFDGDVVSDMLSYIYTGTAPNVNELASELFSIAEKYDIPGLKAAAEKKLALTLTTHNAADFWRLAHMHCGAELKKSAVFWIARHLGDVMETEGWKNMTIEFQRELKDETLEEVARFIRHLTDDPTR